MVRQHHAASRTRGDRAAGVPSMSAQGTGAIQRTYMPKALTVVVRLLLPATNSFTHEREGILRSILASMLALTAVCVALRAPSGASPSSSRRAVLQGAASSLLFGASPAAFAFDTPDLTEFDDPKARALAAGKKNPSLTKQASASFYAITTGDLITLKKMLEAGWQLGEACDTSGKTPMHRAVTGCASNLRRPALLLCCAFHSCRRRWEAWVRSSC